MHYKTNNSIRSRSTGTLRLLKILIAAAVVMLSAPAFAYDVDTGHVPLTSFSLDLYNKCFPASTTFRGADAQKRLIQGNRGMDKGTADMLQHLDLSEQELERLTGRSVFNLTTRIWNWHFYNPDRTGLSRAGLVEQSFSRLWTRLKKGRDSNDDMNSLIFLGGLIHLVEDVSVPAHSVPVYHGPTLIKEIKHDQLKPLVSYMEKAGKAPGRMLKDPIDWISPDSEGLKKDLKPTVEFCSDIGSGSDTPEAIRDGLSRAVSALLLEQIPGCDGVKWGDFWVPPADGEYFGRYAIGNGQPMFGDRGVVRSQSGSACEMGDKDERYAGFVLKLHREAVKADLRMLRWGEKQTRGQ